ncbi:MAG TPA: hypothetical protein VNY09_07085 [Candidatus Sulfotelmatobacter sp.]|jgi:hypothetical protein|nr:hypothetical protein [Candidatus Sulfotelmatobacter sp.]
MKRLLALAALAVLLSIPLHAQTTQTNVDVPFVNAGDHSWVTFYFGHLANGEPGATALIVQCAFHRAELITNFDVYGQQMGSQFFAVTCSQVGPTFVNGKPTTTYTLNGTPLNESLVMYGVNAAGNYVTENLNLIINNASWTASGYGRSTSTSGGAELAY